MLVMEENMWAGVMLEATLHVFCIDINVRGVVAEYPVPSSLLLLTHETHSFDVVLSYTFFLLSIVLLVGPPIVSSMVPLQVVAILTYYHTRSRTFL